MKKDRLRITIALFKRASEDGKFPENGDTIAAFAEGLEASGKATAALAKREEAGRGLTGLALLMVALGGMTGAIVIMSVMMAPTLVYQPGAYGLLAFAFVMFVGAYFARAQGVRAVDRAGAAFDLEWADGQWAKKDTEA